MRQAAIAALYNQSSQPVKMDSPIFYSSYNISCNGSTLVIKSYITISTIVAFLNYLSIGYHNCVVV